LKVKPLLSGQKRPKGDRRLIGHPDKRHRSRKTARSECTLRRKVPFSFPEARRS
jgi:hypothetical protein